MFVLQEMLQSSQANQSLSSPARQTSVDRVTAANGASQPNVPACKCVTACLMCVGGVCMNLELWN